MLYRRSDWRFERTQSRDFASVPWAQPVTGWLDKVWAILMGDAYQYL